MLADALIIRDRGGESHWDESAAALLQTVILYVAGLRDDERHMGTIRELLTRPDRMQALVDSQDAFGLVDRGIRAFLSKEERERSGVLSNAQRPMPPGVFEGASATQVAGRRFPTRR